MVLHKEVAVLQKFHRQLEDQFQEVLSPGQGGVGNPAGLTFDRLWKREDCSGGIWRGEAGGGCL